MENKDFEKRYFDEKFGSIDKRLESINNHLEKMNGRVCKLEETCNEHKVVISDFRHVEKEVEEMKGQVDTLDKELLEVRFFKKYPKVFIGILVISVAAALGMTGFVTVQTSKNSNKIEEVREKVDWIDTKTGVRYRGETNKNK
jgi:tetrahydromethanopterin S-methyltransferase subunit G